MKRDSLLRLLRLLEKMSEQDQNAFLSEAIQSLSAFTQQQEMPLMPSHDVSRAAFQPGFPLAESIEEPGNLISKLGIPMGEPETPSPIRMPNKDELRRLYEAVEGTAPGQPAPGNSDSSSPSKDTTNSSEADT